MGTITVRLGNISQTVSCADGQEAHLSAMAAEVDRRIARLMQNDYCARFRISVASNRNHRNVLDLRLAS